MTMNAGVWIDHDKAIVVLLTDEGQEMLQIRSDQAASARSPAGLRAKNSRSTNDFVGETNRDHNMVSRRNEYYDQIIACVRDAQAILVLGPKEVKAELRTRMARQKLRGHVAEMKTVASLTDQQITDHVRQYFQ